MSTYQTLQAMKKPIIIAEAGVNAPSRDPRREVDAGSPHPNLIFLDGKVTKHWFYMD